MAKVTLVYGISEKLKELLPQAESLRAKILLTPLPPAVERRLRWEANLQKVFWGLSLAENPISKANMAKILASPPKRKLTNFEKEVLGYKKALDYIKEEWLASPKIITPQTILRIYNLACEPVFGSGKASFRAKRQDLAHFLDYLQTGKEHPIIQAGVAQIQIIKISPFEYANRRVARLFTYLMLYKNGFDCRDLLVLEQYYRSDVVGLKEALASVDIQQNLTFWLEYFTKGVVVQLEKALEDIQQQKFKTDLPPSFWRLNEKQKQILQYLEDPQQKITNQQVQQMFKVSQITASRYLAKLASLGLILAHGKGRATFYTKA